MTPLATLTSPSRHTSCLRGGGEACAQVSDVPVGAVEAVWLHQAVHNWCPAVAIWACWLRLCPFKVRPVSKS